MDKESKMSIEYCPLGLFVPSNAGPFLIMISIICLMAKFLLLTV